MSMREKMARAMAVSDSGPEGSDLFAIHWREFADGYLSGVDAALTALSEPTEAMVDAMNEHAGSIAPEYAYLDAIQVAREGK